MLQPFSIKRCSASGCSNQEATGLRIASRPAEVPNALKSEHRVVNIKRDKRAIIGTVGSCRCKPRRKSTRFRNPFFQHLTFFVFAVIHDLVGVCRIVELPHCRIDAHLPEHPFHTESTRLVWHDGHNLFPDFLIFTKRIQHPDKGHCRRLLALPAAFQLSIKDLERRDFQ